MDEDDWGVGTNTLGATCTGEDMTCGLIAILGDSVGRGFFSWGWELGVGLGRFRLTGELFGGGCEEGSAEADVWVEGDSWSRSSWWDGLTGNHGTILEVATCE